MSSELSARPPIALDAEGPVRLAVSVDSAKLKFAYASGDEWRDVGPPLDSSILSDEAGGGEHRSFTAPLSAWSHSTSRAARSAPTSAISIIRGGMKKRAETLESYARQSLVCFCPAIAPEFDASCVHDRLRQVTDAARGPQSESPQILGRRDRAHADWGGCCRERLG